MQQYEATKRFDNTNYMVGNHFRFVIEALPDLSFYTQSAQLPSIGVPVAPTNNPFVKIAQTGDHMDFGTMDVNFLVDSKFKTYFSLFAWLRGYGFPNSYEDIAEFKDARVKQIPNVLPLNREIVKTNATLYLLQPDTDQTIAEVRFYDIFPTALGALTFTTIVPADAPILTTLATFYYTHFEVVVNA